jgi:hypothetical protein
MELAMVGLGKMGYNMSHRLLRGGHKVIGFAHDPQAIEALGQLGGVGAQTLKEAIDKLAPPRIIWLMIPAGNPTFETIEDLIKILSPAILSSTVATPIIRIPSNMPGCWGPKGSNLSTAAPAAACGVWRKATA